MQGLIFKWNDYLVSMWHILLHGSLQKPEHNFFYIRLLITWQYTEDYEYFLNPLYTFIIKRHHFNSSARTPLPAQTPHWASFTAEHASYPATTDRHLCGQARPPPPLLFGRHVWILPNVFSPCSPSLWFFFFKCEFVEGNDQKNVHPLK